MHTPLPDAAIEDALAALPGWSREGGKLHKRFVLKDSREALALISRIGLEAQAHNHHPTLHNIDNAVTVDLCTHDAGGRITQKDIALAQAIESVVSSC